MKIIGLFKRAPDSYPESCSDQLDDQRSLSVVFAAVARHGVYVHP